MMKRARMLVSRTFIHQNMRFCRQKVKPNPQRFAPLSALFSVYHIPSAYLNWPKAGNLIAAIGGVVPPLN